MNHYILTVLLPMLRRNRRKPELQDNQLPAALTLKNLGLALLLAGLAMAATALSIIF